MAIIFRICLFILISACPLYAETTATVTDSIEQRISWSRFAIVGGVSAGAFVYGHIFQSNLWWKGEKSSFHFDNDHDYRYALNADKFGHFFFPYLMSNVYRQAFLWTRMDTAASIFASSGLALSYELYVEVKDGFSKEWGFSWGDATADAIGASLPVVQHYIPALRPFTFKISFYPSAKFRAGAYKAIIDDYESTYDWMSINVHTLLPVSWRSSWPTWLNLAVGHSVKGLDLQGAGHHEWYLSLDWNLEALPGDGWLLHLLKHNLNYYHLPAPAVRLYPNIVWYGLKF